MWTRYLGAAGFFVILASTGAADADGRSAELTAADRQAIAAVPDEYVKQARADDWDAVADLHHDDAIQMLPDEPPVEGREAIRQALAQMLGTEGGVTLTNFSVEILETEGLGDLAYVRATYRFDISMTVGEEEVTAEQRGPYMNILRRDDEGRWRIYRQIVNRDHPPVGPD